MLVNMMRIFASFYRDKNLVKCPRGRKQAPRLKREEPGMALANIGVPLEAAKSILVRDTHPAYPPPLIAVITWAFLWESF